MRATAARLVLGQMVEREPRDAAAQRRHPLWMRRVLGIPLGWKLAGANALIVVVAMATAMAVHESSADERGMLTILAVALAVSFAANLALVAVALRPLRDLESTAARVRQGDLAARASASLLADRGVRRVGVALNDLLDALEADRARVRRLASEVIRAGDRERARLARELHDSTAQTLSALVMQSSAIARETQDPALAGRLEAIRAAAIDALEEVRTLSHTVHPRVLDDLGLSAALRNLGREIERRSGIPIEVEAIPRSDQLSPDVEATLYRVAQEALSNAVRHGDPTAVRLRFETEDGVAALEITDDGAGFDAGAAARNGDGLGIFSMRERLALVNGVLELVSQPGKGTRLRASVPLRSANSSRGSA